MKPRYFFISFSILLAACSDGKDTPPNPDARGGAQGTSPVAMSSDLMDALQFSYDSPSNRIDEACVKASPTND